MANPHHLNILYQGVDTWNCWRKLHSEIRPDLSGVDLSEMRLQRVDMSRANLMKVNLREAKLDRSKFVNAFLIDANFSEAYLYKARFNEANLSGANFYHAYLSKCNFSKANLSGVDFSGTHFTDTKFHQASVGGTVFGNNNLSDIQGIETLFHRGPSTIGIDTIYRSKRPLPKVFLQGVGVPEQLITYIQALKEEVPIEMFYSCFISYSHADKLFAQRLHNALQSKGIRCWMDEHQLLPGHDIYDEVDQGIKLWDKVLLCASQSSLTSWWVDKEISTAFEKEQALWRQRGVKTLALIPLNLDGFMFSSEWNNGKATEIRTRFAADFIGWEQDREKFEKQLERLIIALRMDS